MLAAVGGNRAQQTPCSEGVRQVPATADPLGYRQRGERCEGRYSFQPYAGPNLRIISFAYAEESFPRDGRDLVHLDWCARNRGAQVSIQAVAIDPRFLYRMDARLPKGKPDVMRWPMDVVAGLRLTDRDLGVVARISASYRGEPIQALVPLRISRDMASGRCPSTVSFIVLSSIDLSSLRVRLWAAHSAQGTSEPAVLDKTFRSGPYLAHKPITLPVDLPPDSGLFTIEIGGRVGENAKDGSVAVEDYLLCEP
jgi:hypothetical protein